MLAIAGYEWLKFGHVLSAILWVGGTIVIEVLALRAVRAEDPARAVAILRDSLWIDRFVYAPATLAVIGFGAAAVENGSLGWGTSWVDAGLAVWVATAALNGLVIRPQSNAVVRTFEQDGAAAAGLGRRLRLIVAASSFDVALLVFAVAMMTLKP